MAEIFISYSRRDSAFVHTLQEALHNVGRETWVDWQDIPPTAEWLAEIHAAIEAADTFVFVISPDAIASHVCGLELTHAVEQHKRLVPIVRRDVTPADAPEAIAKLNWIFFRESDDFAPSLKTLLEAIDLDLARARTHTRLLTRALEWERRNCDGSLLLRGRDLHEAEDVLALTSAERTPQPTDLQRAYVLASRHAARRTQRVALTAVCAAAAVLAVLAVLAWLQRNEAVREQLIASSRELASYSSQQLHANPELSLLLAVQAALSSDGKLLALSPDGKWIVLAGGPGTARIWGAGSGNEVEVLGGESVGGLDAAFSPDDRWAGTADWNTGPGLYECLVCSPLNDRLSLAGSRAKRGFTPEEHSRYLHQGLGAYR